MSDLLDYMVLAHGRNPHWDGVGIGVCDGGGDAPDVG